MSFAKSQKTQVEGCSEMLTFLFDLSVWAWSAERSIAISCESRATFRSCVGAIMLRTTTLENAGFFAPQ